MAKEKTERNRQIYEDKKNGASYKDLIIKYGLSMQTLQRIVTREKLKELEEKAQE